MLHERIMRLGKDKQEVGSFLLFARLLMRPAADVSQAIAFLYLSCTPVTNMQGLIQSMAEPLTEARASARESILRRRLCHSLRSWLEHVIDHVSCRCHAHAEAYCEGHKAPHVLLTYQGRWCLTGQALCMEALGSHTSMIFRRSLVRARADAEAMEARAHQAESAEASLAADLRNAEAQSLSNEGLIAKCATLEERLSEMRAEQVSHWPDSVLLRLVFDAMKRQADITLCCLHSMGRPCRSEVHVAHEPQA